MKKISIAVLLLILPGIFIYAQNLDVAKAILHLDNDIIFEKAGLSDTQIDEIKQAKFETMLILDQAQIELNLCKAQLEQELYYDEVDFEEIENILTKSHEWRMKTELAEIKLYIRIRNIVTRDVLQRLVYEVRNYLQQQNRENQQ